MDPEAAYDAFLDALKCGDAEVASHRLDDLAAWLARGGFVPSNLRIRGRSAPDLARLLQSAAVVLGWAASDLNREGETL